MDSVRSVFRTLLRKPGFALVAILTLAFGIAANTAIFVFAEGLLLRPLPYADPGRLVFVWQVGPDDFGDEVGTSVLDYLDWRRETRQFDALAAYGRSGFNVAAADGAEYVEGQVVSANFFDTLGARTAIGRGFRLDEENVGAPRVVVLSDGLWRRQYGADRAIVGKTIQLSGEPYTVAGVMPARWRAPERAELWVPLAFYTGNWRQWRATHQLTLIGRLAPHAGAAAAEAELRPLAQRIWNASGGVAFREWTLRVEPMTDQLLGDYRRTVVALWVAVALVLLITCANLANLLLVRGISRARELAVRAALGAATSRLVFELVAEALLIAAAGAVLGIGGAAAALRAAVALLPQELEHLIQPHLSAAAVAYGSAIALVSALLFSAIPAWRARRADARTLLASARTIGGRHRVGYAFVAVQVALSVPLLAGCFLMGQTMRNFARVEPGVRAESAIAFRVAPSPALYAEPASRPELYRRIEERLASMPGVSHAGMASNIPFSRVGTQTATSVFVEGRPREERGAADVRATSPAFLRAAGMRLVRGRWIEARDATGPRVAVVNETMARTLWPKGDPIGARILDGNDPGSFDVAENWFTIVGIVADARSGGLRTEPVPEVYLPYAKRPTRSMMFVLRGAGVDGLPALARTAVNDVDPRQPIFDVAELRDLVGESIAGPRLAFRLFASLGLVALLLATVGTYGVVAYAVGLRRQELGVRASLGATPANLWRMILSDGVRVAVLGLAAGLLLARAGASVLASVLYGVTTTDSFAPLIAVATLLLAVLIATFIPALRAMRVTPAEALREE